MRDRVHECEREQLKKGKRWRESQSYARERSEHKLELSSAGSMSSRRSTRYTVVPRSLRVSPKVQRGNLRHDDNEGAPVHLWACMHITFTA